MDDSTDTKSSSKNLNGIIYSIYTHKGGVGKTTIIKELCDHAIKYKHNTNILLIDCDTQYNLSTILSGDIFLDLDEKWSIKSIWSSRQLSNPFIMRHRNPKIDIYLGSDEDDRTISQLSSLFSNRKLHDNDVAIIEKFKELKSKYNYIFLDLNPSLSVINKFLLLLSDRIICPVLPDNYSVIGCQKLFNFINSHSDLIPDHKVKISGFVMNHTKFLLNEPTIHSNKFLNTFKSVFKDSGCISQLPHISNTDFDKTEHQLITLKGNNKFQTIKSYQNNIQLLFNFIFNNSVVYMTINATPLDQKGNHFVYLISEEYNIYDEKTPIEDRINYFKIGKSSGDINEEIKRIKSLQTGNLRELKLESQISDLSVGMALNLEQYLKKCFCRYNTRILGYHGGTEWFEFNSHQLIICKNIFTSHMVILMELSVREMTVDRVVKKRKRKLKQ